MSFLTAILGGFGGYGQGRYQQEQLKQNQEYADMAKQQWDYQKRAYQQNQGINPDTGQPYQMPSELTQIRPNNAGRGGPATPEEMLAHYMKVAQWYRQTGQTDAAADAMSMAKDYNAQILTGDRFQQQLWMKQNVPTYMQQQMLEYDKKNGLPPGTTAWQYYNEQLNQQWGPPGTRMSPFIGAQYDILNRTGMLPARPSTTNPQITAEGKYSTQIHSKAASAYGNYARLKTQLMKPTDPDDPDSAPINTLEAALFDKLVVQLQGDPTPEKSAEKFIAQTKDPNKAFVTLIRAYATWQQLLKQSDTVSGKYTKQLENQMSAPAGAGGSQGNIPFPR